MDNQNSMRTRSLDYWSDLSRQDSDPTCRALAPMVVPHIAENQVARSRGEGFIEGRFTPIRAPFVDLDPATKLDMQVRSGGPSTGKAGHDKCKETHGSASRSIQTAHESMICPAGGQCAGTVIDVDAWNWRVRDWRVPGCSSGTMRTCVSCYIKSKYR